MKNIKTYKVIMESTYIIDGVEKNYTYYGQFYSIEQATKEAFKIYGLENVLRIEEL